ncbi:CvpA family protein, partial [Enterococcus faecalis]|uniref:CvpA family protein n=2 Tax=Bacteria TaxID=2 RepID=UPI003D6A27CE
VVIGVVLLSALLAAVRGFTREVLAIVSWVAAAAVAWAFHPQLVPFIEQYIPASSAQATISLVASIAVLFLGTLILVSLLTA